jgi:hypothetical protein
VVHGRPGPGLGVGGVIGMDQHVDRTDRGLPSVDRILGQALASLDEAYRALGDAQDWLRSDWSPVGSSLTVGQAHARFSLLAGLAAAKRDLNRARAQASSADGGR